MRDQRPDANEYGDYYHKYIIRVPDGDVVDTLASEIAETRSLLLSLDDTVASSRYAEGKWSVKEVVGHMIDCERVYNYRALRFSRNDAIPLPGFDENAYAAAANYHIRTLPDILDELQNLRRSTVDFFMHLSPDMWSRRGSANGHPCTVRAVAWILAGHERHHRGVISDRYLV
jgi:hypothetical protein